MSKYLALLLLCIGGSVFSQTLYVGQMSHHFKERGGGQEYRESHPLLIYETKQNVLLGCYRNSLDKNSCLLGHRYAFIEDKVSLGVKWGVISGYEVPVFAIFNLQWQMFDVNILPTELVSVGFRFKWE